MISTVSASEKRKSTFRRVGQGSSGGARPGARESISGLIERVTYHAEESGFVVLQVRIGTRRDTISIVGRLALPPSPGEILHAEGVWAQDAVYGIQFRADELRVHPPDTLEGLEKYLSSGVIRGVGKATAKKLVAKFGDDLIEILDNTPSKLTRIPGIGKAKAKRIGESWAGQKAAREIMIFLHSHGIGPARAMHIVRKYGERAIDLVSEDPYRLARDIRGIGFETADAIALRLGIERTDIRRARAGISHALGEAAGRGHCGLPRDELLPFASELLEIPAELVEEALALEVASRRVVADTMGGGAAFFLAPLHQAERDIARWIEALRSDRIPWPEIDAARAVPWVEKKLSLELSETQREALRVVLQSKVSVITGGPGVGKTTLMRALITILGAKDVDIALCAPTGRAAKRLSETTGLAAKTIHRLLEVNRLTGRFQRSELDPIEADLVIVDEASMIDVTLMQSLVRAIPARSGLLIVGDVDQLPSVGPGQVLSDVIESGAVPVVRLTEIFRQSAESTIIVNAHAVNHGRMPELDTKDGDFYFVGVNDPEDGQRKALRVLTERIPKRFGLDPMTDVQLLSPMIKGGLGTRAMNLLMQEALNPRAIERPSVENHGFVFSAGDKVMQIENDYEKDVYNGDLGRITTVRTDPGEVVVEFDGRPVTYGFSDLDKLTLAYATTIHKSQGSEYPAVVVLLSTQHYTMLQRRLLYTAITRGKRLVVLIGEKRAVSMAVADQNAPNRWSKLREWLSPEERARGEAGSRP
jgi:exodeoxyribonuclease V alpha subunit